jgi:hypothetical protein
MFLPDRSSILTKLLTLKLINSFLIFPQIMLIIFRSKRTDASIVYVLQQQKSHGNYPIYSNIPTQSGHGFTFKNIIFIETLAQFFSHLILPFFR